MITLGEYLSWVKEQGGEVKEGHGANHEKGYVPVFVLRSPSGKEVRFIDEPHETPLPLNAIKYFNRRLGIEDNFKKSDLNKKIPKHES